jgi:glycerophosphoryl diester phosphodiesterase
MPAFAHAVDVGYRYLETDVHLTADGVLVAFHDTDLRRTTGHPGEIIDMTWADLAELRVDGREPIPLMRDLLERWPDVRFNIDCKSDAAVVPLAQLVTTTDSLSRVCIGSFSHRRLQRTRTLLGPRVLTSLSPQEIATLRLAGLLRGKSPRIAQVPVRTGFGRRSIEIVTKQFLARARRVGVEVHVWTINDEVEMDRLIDLGVDGIMTDRPELLRAVLERRGLWHD